MRKMRNRKKTTAPLLLLCASVALLLLSTVGSARAALTYYSENYAMEVTVSSIGVTLTENGKDVGFRNYIKDDWSDSGTGELLKDLVPEDGKLIPGRNYGEALGVRNSGTIDAYVRVTLYRSWREAPDSSGKEGKKRMDLSPDLIEFDFAEGSGWVRDEKASTEERIVLYYTKVLPSQGSTPALCGSVRISNDIYREIEETNVVEDGSGKTYETVYRYNGCYMSVKAQVDAVQTHSAAKAIKSAWGVDMDVASDGTLSMR